MLKVVGASWKKMQLSTWIIGAVLVLGIVVIILGELGHYDEDGNWAATVYWSKETGFEIVFWGQGRDVEDIPKGVARAYYKSHLNATGWDVLDIETQSEYPDWVQAFGAGMLEGSLTWQMIDWQRRNTINRVCDDKEYLCGEIKDYLVENFKWVKQIYKNSMKSYWYQVRMFYLQLEGLHKGFEQGVKRSRAHDVEEMSLDDFLWLNALDDIEDLMRKFSSLDLARGSSSSSKAHESKPFKSERKRSIERYSSKQQSLVDSSNAGQVDEGGVDVDDDCKCGHGQLSMASAFVKLVADDARLYVAHNSAGHYSSMLKMIKHYRFGYRRSKEDSTRLSARKLTFSSHPGVIHSVDDFYVVEDCDANLKIVVTATSIPVYNRNLWIALSPVGQVMVGPRIMAANRLCSDTREWVDVLSRYNSGTGNKEWIVVDVGKFEGIARLRAESEESYRKSLSEARDILWIAEQIPGLFEAGDKTQSLRSATYWASYGLPFFENVTVLSGVDAMAKESGDVYSYDEAPLAKMFRRDGSGVADADAIAGLMRSNSYKTDPFSRGNPRCAIGSRGDLGSRSQEAEPVGVTDTKIYSSASPPGFAPGALPERFLNATDIVGRDGELRMRAGPPYSTARNVLNRTSVRGDDGDLRPFDWTRSEFADVPHVGHPDVWDFEAIVVL